MCIIIHKCTLQDVQNGTTFVHKKYIHVGESLIQRKNI